MCDLHKHLSDMVINIHILPIKTESQIKDELDICIKEERYEDACLLRDGKIYDYQLKYDKDNFIVRINPNE